MNNILFKAKRIDNGETVYGWPCPAIPEGCWLIIDDKCYNYPVDPESIKQWTTLYDKYGNMIFDGDKVRISIHNGYTSEEDIIRWKNGAWFVEHGVFCGSQILGSYKAECLEVLNDN